ncbi:hypothetical protein T484DRAFT_1834349 [Baffinella frigidus]|nr:hypothetical protein T484DRAFT_1834349 [Cryptophyta sp. CCMP2293]
MPAARVGTDTHKDNPASSNSVLLAQVHRGSHASSAARIVRQAVAHLDAPVACIDWLSGTELIVANGSNLTVLQMHDGEMRERAKISELHSDSIRDMKLSTFKRESCLSVGFDGQCYITDLDKVVSARLSSRKHSEASNPNLANQVSIATDCGHLHVFDTRLSNPDRRGMVIKTGKQGLYANAWVDAYSALLG